MNNIIGIFVSLLLPVALLAQKPPSSHQIVYEADESGTALSGSRAKLVSLVQQGHPLRVGWILTMIHPTTKEKIEMQHWADAGFVTTLKGHVFAQVRPIFQQGPSLEDPPGVFLANGMPNGWVAIIGTTGVVRQKFKPDEAMRAMLKEQGLSEEEIAQFEKNQEQMKVHTKWAIRR